MGTASHESCVLFVSWVNKLMIYKHSLVAAAADCSDVAEFDIRRCYR